MDTTEYIRTDSSDIRYRELTALLDADLKIRDGEDHAFFAQYNKSDHIHHIILALQNGIAVGCGAFKAFEGPVCEIKRMYVRPEARNRGIAGKILSALESWAVSEGYTHTILETGIKQPEAIHLYKKSGYHQIPNYGQYKDVSSSVCMKKHL